MSDIRTDTAFAVRLTGPVDSEGFPPEGAWETAPPVRFHSDWQGKNGDKQRETQVRLLGNDEFLFVRFDASYRDITVFEDAEPLGWRELRSRASIRLGGPRTRLSRIFMCPRRLGRWCSRTRRAKSGASEAASFFLCLRRAAPTPLVPIRKFDQYDGSQPCGGCTCCSATPDCKFSRQFSCRGESRTAELVAAADAGAHGVAKWAASGSDGSHVQSSGSRGGTHAGDGGRELSFRGGEIGSGAEIGYGRFAD